ncbi:MAG TPA: glycosyltransferase [Phycisphaerae bacterium]
MHRRRTLVVFLDDHYVATPAGVFGTLALPYTYWKQYLEAFDEVRLVARVAQRAQVDPRWNRADGPGVQFIPIPEYAGFWENLTHLPRNLARARAGLAAGDFYLLKGSTLAAFAWIWLTLLRRPYARTVMGHEGFTVALLPNLQRFGLASRVAQFTHWLGCRQVQGAACVHYWSHSLHAAYPPPRGAPRYVFAEVELADGVLTGPRGAETFCADPLRLVSVGRMSPEKGYRELLEALKILHESGERRWTLEAVGGGPELEKLRELVVQYGLADRIRFVGLIPWGPELFARLDHADLYVLPSLTEGMPRAPLEAMARGLPVISTTVGGMPDVVGPAQLVPPGDPGALADVIQQYIGQRSKLAAMSPEAFHVAMRFHPSQIRKEKLAYWTSLRECTQRWRRVTGRANRSASRTI